MRIGRPSINFFCFVVFLSRWGITDMGCFVFVVCRQKKMAVNIPLAAQDIGRNLLNQ